MTKEIRFRGMSEGKWYYGLLTFMFGSYAIVDPKDENTVHLVEEETIGQHIGRSTEGSDYIFEKECVYYLDLLKKPIQTGETIPDEIDGIPISLESDEETNRLYFSEYIDEADVNILGNIYDNPELLNE